VRESALSKQREAQVKRGLALLVPGGHGQLGSDIAALAADRVGYVCAPGSAELDITDKVAVHEAVMDLVATALAADLRPVVVNAAAYTAVDAAESDEPRALMVNMVGAAALAAACGEFGASLVQVSTDYVFGGDAVRPYEPGDETGPRSAYGRTKLAGEKAVLTSGANSWVVRTSWVYGATGGNFVKTIARLERERDTLSVVDDQRGSPTYSADLAGGLLTLAEMIASGTGPSDRVLHLVGAGETTWFGLARAVFEELGVDPKRVRPCASTEFPRPAPRPAYSVLSNQAWVKAGLPAPRAWRPALAAFFAEHGATLR
jgi:dTDP-4-dehydrorhamnose reductase